MQRSYGHLSKTVRLEGCNPRCSVSRPFIGCSHYFLYILKDGFCAGLRQPIINLPEPVPHRMDKQETPDKAYSLHKIKKYGCLRWSVSLTNDNQKEIAIVLFICWKDLPISSTVKTRLRMHLHKSGRNLPKVCIVLCFDFPEYPQSYYHEYTTYVRLIIPGKRKQPTSLFEATISSSREPAGCRKNANVSRVAETCFNSRILTFPQPAHY